MSEDNDNYYFINTSLCHDLLPKRPTKCLQCCEQRVCGGSSCLAPFLCTIRHLTKTGRLYFCFPPPDGFRGAKGASHGEEPLRFLLPKPLAFQHRGTPRAAVWLPRRGPCRAEPCRAVLACPQPRAACSPGWCRCFRHFLCPEHRARSGRWLSPQARVLCPWPRGAWRRPRPLPCHGRGVPTRGHPLTFPHSGRGCRGWGE